MSTKTKKQHYVWEFYLKGWATDGQIWVKREEVVFKSTTEKEGVVLKSSTENIAQQRYFYETSPFTPEEVTFLEIFILQMPPSILDVARMHLNEYIHIAQSEDAKTGVERLHSKIERRATKALKELRSGNEAVLNDEQIRTDFLRYISNQYTRTKKIRFSLSALHEKSTLPEGFQSIDRCKIDNAIAYLMAVELEESLRSLDLRLVKNTSNINLISSDQPIYELSSAPGSDLPEPLIYFPISPAFALIATKSPNTERIDTNERADDLNDFMRRVSHEFLFAKNKEDLLRLSGESGAASTIVDDEA